MNTFQIAAAEARKQIATLDLSNYLKKAQRLFCLAENETKQAALEYRHFLYLVLRNRYSGNRTPIVPTIRADKVWHAHLLFNTEYNPFCIDLCGEIIGHQPGLEEGTAPFNSAVEHTQMIHERFGYDGFDPGYFSNVGQKPSDKKNSGSTGCSSDCSSVPAAKSDLMVAGGAPSICGSHDGGSSASCCID